MMMVQMDLQNPWFYQDQFFSCADGDGGTRDGGTMVQGVDDVQPAVLQIIETEQPVQQPVEQPVQRPVEQPEQSTTRSGRVRRKPACMEDYVLNDNFNNQARFCMAAVVSSTDVPTSIHEALEVFGVPDGHQDGVLECTNRRGDLHAATGWVRECGRGRTTVGVPVAEIVVWAETVWEELAPDVDRVPCRAGIQSINQRRVCVHKDGQ